MSVVLTNVSLEGDCHFPWQFGPLNIAFESTKHVEHFPLTDKIYEWKEHKNARDYCLFL